MQLARKATHNNPALRPLIHHLAHTVLNIEFTVRMGTVTFTVSRLVHKQQEAFFLGDFANPIEIEFFAIDRIFFNTPVAAREDITNWRPHHYGSCIRNRVIDTY